MSQAEPDSGQQQATPTEAPRGKKLKKDNRGRTIPFLTVLLPMVTALITFLATLVGLWWPTNEDRNEKADQAAVLDQQVQDLDIELEAEQEANGILQDDVDSYVATVTSLQDQVDQLSTTTTVASLDEDDDSSLPRGPDGEVAVFRETGDQPLRLNDGYWMNLDTLDDNWGVADSGASSASDINLRSSSSTGLELRSLSDVVAVMDHEASYEECEAATNLQDEIGNGLTVEGTQFCTRTDQGRWTFITILEVHRVDGYIVLDITVWEPQT